MTISAESEYVARGLSLIDKYPVIESAEVWYQRPSILLAVEEQNVPNDELLKLQNQILGPVFDVYQSNGCDTGVIRRDGTRNYNAGFDFHNARHMTVINPIQVTELYPREYKKAYDGLSGHKNLDSFKKFMRSNFPEERTSRPHLAQVANDLRIDESNYGNVINMIFLHDPENKISQLPYDQAREFWRFAKAKFGTLKVIGVPYIINRDGDFRARNVSLSSLEDGRPEFNALGEFDYDQFTDFSGNTYEELARRMMIFASATKPEDGGILDEVIPNISWMQSPDINGVMEFGHFLGERGLMPGQIDLSEYVNRRNIKYALYCKRMVRWATQSPGAYYINAILKNAQGLYESYDVVSVSGKFGAVKSKPNLEDFIAIKLNNEGNVGVIPIQGVDVKGKSVESDEFYWGQRFMKENFPISLHIDPDGQIRIKNDRSGLLVSPNRAITHGHWGARIEDKKFVARANMRVQGKKVNTGCESKIANITRPYGLLQGEIEVNTNGGDQKIVIIENDSHGIDIVERWAPDENGQIPADPLYHTKKAIKEGRLILNDRVFNS